jgi:hypothetical protein
MSTEEKRLQVMISRNYTRIVQEGGGPSVTCPHKIFEAHKDLFGNDWTEPVRGQLARKHLDYIKSAEKWRAAELALLKPAKNRVPQIQPNSAAATAPFVSEFPSDTPVPCPRPGLVAAAEQRKCITK